MNKRQYTNYGPRPDQGSINPLGDFLKGGAVGTGGPELESTGLTPPSSDVDAGATELGSAGATKLGSRGPTPFPSDVSKNINVGIENISNNDLPETIGKVPDPTGEEAPPTTPGVG